MFRYLCSHCVMNKTDCRITSDFDFFLHNTHEGLFLCDFQKKSINFETQIFRVSLGKFGQKSFAPPKICLPLHLVVSRPIFASLSLESFKSRLSLEGYVPAYSQDRVQNILSQTVKFYIIL